MRRSPKEIYISASSSGNIFRSDASSTNPSTGSERPRAIAATAWIAIPLQLPAWSSHLSCSSSLPKSVNGFHEASPCDFVWQGGTPLRDPHLLLHSFSASTAQLHSAPQHCHFQEKKRAGETSALTCDCTRIRQCPPSDLMHEQGGRFVRRYAKTNKQTNKQKERSRDATPPARVARQPRAN